MSKKKCIVKYTRYTEYEVEVDIDTKNTEWDKKVEKMIEDNPSKYEIDSWISYDDHVVL